MRKLIAFDFHGVLSMNNEKAVKYYIDLALSTLGFSLRIDLAMIVKHYGISFRNYFEMLLPDAQPQLYDDLVAVVVDSQALSFEPVRWYIQPQMHAVATLNRLREIRDSGSLIVVSNTPQEYIQRFTDAVGLTSCFHHVIGVNDSGGISCGHHLKSYKASVLTDIAKQESCEEIFMVGDAASDILAGKEAGAKTFLFCSPRYDEICDMSEKWSSIISQTQPDFVIKDLREIISAIET